MLSTKKTSIIDTNHFFFVKYFLKNCVHEYNVFTFSTLLLSLQFPSFPKSLLDFNNYYCHTQTHVRLYPKTLLDPFSVPFLHMYVGSTKWSCITYQASCPWRWKLILPPSAASHCLQFLILGGGAWQISPGSSFGSYIFCPFLFNVFLTFQWWCWGLCTSLSLTLFIMSIFDFYSTFHMLPNEASLIKGECCTYL